MNDDDDRLLDLNPRASAIVLALRRSRLSISEIRERIGDPYDEPNVHRSTDAMVRELVKIGFVQRTRQGTDYCLTETVTAWLVHRGLKAEYLP